MALEMKARCERCDADLDRQAEAFICAYECTFCSSCSERMDQVCPNCSGELVRRPRGRAESA